MWQILNIGELVITIVFDIELIVHFIAHLPDWQGFFIHGNNYLDLVLTILSCHFGDTTYEATVAFHVRMVIHKPWLSGSIAKPSQSWL